jgi:hypothetical protein
MAKFEKFNPVGHIRRLALTAKALREEELSRIASDRDIEFPFGANAPSDNKEASVPEKKPASRKRRVN